MAYTEKYRITDCFGMLKVLCFEHKFNQELNDGVGGYVKMCLQFVILRIFDATMCRALAWESSENGNRLTQPEIDTLVECTQMN